MFKYILKEPNREVSFLFPFTNKKSVIDWVLNKGFKVVKVERIKGYNEE